jgi:phosphoribosylformimino-5-aminoimidazole carboxamide ribotide isomerase
VKIYPAIDLLDGCAVRLRKGLREDVTIYSKRPWELIAQFAEAGAEHVHIVDLNGAFDGARRHSAIVERLCKESPIPVQLGGGIRDEATLASALQDGASWVVLGTAAVKNPQFAKASCQAHPGKVVVAVDAKDGMVAVEGWVETSQISAAELGKQAESWGAYALLYTDVSRDGMHTGPNIRATAELAAAVNIPVIASGGVSSLDDLRALNAENTFAAIVGRALYDKHFSLSDALEVAGEC